MSRYQIDQVIPFIKVKFHAKPNKFAFSRLYLPQDHILDSVDVKLFRVIEHHKVPWDQDPKEEKKYDGFILLEEETNTRWYNQYPKASYGQTDTGNNLIIRPEDKKSFKFEDYYYYPFKDALVYAEEIERLFVDPKLKNVLDEDYDGFNEFKQQVIQKIEQKTNMKVQFRPTKITTINGEVHQFPDIPEAFLTAS